MNDAAAPGTIDTDRFSNAMRLRALDLQGQRVLITDFRGSAQEADFTLPANCGGVGRIRHFRRETRPGWPSNPLPIDPALRALGLPNQDILQAQVFQNAACNWRCWYCFVPYDRLSADESKSAWLTADQLLDRFEAEPIRSPVIDLTGGQPDLVPEWTLWMIDALRRRGLSESVYLWSDDNLSNDFFIRHLSRSERARVRNYKNYGRVGCFKGFDPESFAFNTRAAPELFTRQFEVMNRLIDEGLDVYAYATLTTPKAATIKEGVRRFVDRLQAVDSNLPLRTVPLRIEQFSPTGDRMSDVHRAALANQEIAIEAWTGEIATRFSADARSANVAKVGLRGRLA